MVGETKVVVVGSANIDLVTYASRVPRAGETLVGDRFSTGFGGKGANQAVMARLLGADVAMIGCIGDDAYGDMTIENFESYGVDTSHLHRSTGSNGVAHIWVEPDGSNRIIVVPGANSLLTPAQAAGAVGDTSGTAVLVGQLEIPQEVTKAAFAAASEKDWITILNPAPASSLDRELIALSTWLVPNEVEFEALTGRRPIDDDALVDFAQETETRLLVTLGRDGVALISSEGDLVRLPVAERDAIDTTGAGDAFVGAFAFGLASGMNEFDAIGLGNACAGESVTRAGAQTSFPDADRSAQLLETIWFAEGKGD